MQHARFSEQDTSIACCAGVVRLMLLCGRKLAVLGLVVACGLHIPLRIMLEPFISAHLVLQYVWITMPRRLVSMPVPTFGSCSRPGTLRERLGP